MKKEVLNCIYNYISEVNDSPFSMELIASECKLNELEVKVCFDILEAEGIIERKKGLSKVYNVTKKGVEFLGTSFPQRLKTA